MHNHDPALLLTGLHKSFGRKVAVRNVHLAVPRGSLFGLVGPNGAGKTTTLSMAVGLLRPDGGSASILGSDVWAAPQHAKALVGVLPEDLALPERLTGRELLTYFGQLRGLDAATVAQRIDDLLRVLDMAEAATTMVVDCSAGMRKKIGLAAAMLHAPGLLVLDEPFESVDPISAATIRAILQRFVATGGAVVLSSHVMELVERLCDNVGVIARGEIVASGPTDTVRGGGSLQDRFVSLVGDSSHGEEGLSWLES